MMAPTAYRERRNLPASTVVTQYRLDKAGMRSCLQDDITLNDGHVGSERTPTRLCADVSLMPFKALVFQIQALCALRTGLGMDRRSPLDGGVSC